MDYQTERVVRQISFDVSDGISRTEVVESLVQQGWDPQSAQNLWSVATLYAAGDGRTDFGSWLKVVVTSQAPARGRFLVAVIALISLILAIPLNLALIGSLPAGRYPGLLLALPSLIFAGIIIAVVTAVLFQKWVKPGASKRGSKSTDRSPSAGTGR